MCAKSQPLNGNRSSARQASRIASLAEVLPRGLLVEIEHELQRLQVDLLVPAVEHVLEVAERDLRAVDAVAVRGHALAAKEPGVRGADAQHRHDLSTFE